MKLLEDRKELRIPIKLIRLTTMLLNGSQAIIKTKEGIPDKVKIEAGVRQGDTLSSTLFNIALAGAMKQAELTRAIAQSLTQMVADNIGNKQKHSEVFATVAGKSSKEKGSTNEPREN